ncbi:citrate synthase [Oceanobacillus piezotolerans]|uniref:Citrate synthase n=1 Tax=Oceanobacillus piezotolerans TaxID=2448030 RepID=A0A498DQY0_9BACI|nr:citrate synthase [Oceanobacillus piezotolerans]RLL46879.1 citrate synthase [Oceanobacillus piezotolerans]
MKIKETFAPGLDGVIAAETEISFLDVEKEKIIIQGYDLIELSKNKDYLEVVHLLLEGVLPNASEKAALKERLAVNYELPTNVLKVLDLLSPEIHPMDAMRTGISVLAGHDDSIDDRSLEVNKKRAYQLLGLMPTLTVNSYRILNGKEPVAPLKDLSYSENFLYMITGQKPTELETRVFDQLLLLYSEHEMPNSTFTARVIASTNSDLYGALTGAISSLKGNLHGGANEAVMYMLQEADTIDGFEAIIHEKLRQKEKIMGFGHRVYMKKMDPRAVIVKEALKELSSIDGDNSLLEKCEAGERIMAEEKGLYPNLDYYAAPVYFKLGIPIPLYTPIFFSARTAGIAAHVMEQHENNRIFRPRVNYIGKQYE